MKSRHNKRRMRPRGTNPTKQRSIRFDNTLWARLEAEALRQNRTVANLIHHLLSGALDFLNEEQEVFTILREQRRTLLRRAIPPMPRPRKKPHIRPRRV